MLDRSLAQGGVVEVNAFVSWGLVNKAVPSVRVPEVDACGPSPHEIKSPTETLSSLAQRPEYEASAARYPTASQTLYGDILHLTLNHSRSA